MWRGVGGGHYVEGKEVQEHSNRDLGNPKAHLKSTHQLKQSTNPDITLFPPSSNTLQARIEALTDMPVTPKSLLFTAPLIPQTCVPWP